MTSAGAPSRPATGFRRVRGLLPRGSDTVGAWLLVAGLAAYGFLTVAGRALGSERASALSALWALGFLLAPGTFMPVEQELARALAERRALGLGGRPVARRAAVGAAVLAAVLVAGLACSAPFTLHRLFDGQVLLLVGLGLLLVGYAIEHVAKGVLAGADRFGPYGRLNGAEALVRLGAGALLAVGGVRSAGPFGLALGLAPFAGVAVALVGQRDLLRPGPPAARGELTRSIGWLLLASLLAQVLLNAGPVVVQALAGPGQRDAAGQFLASLVIARVPVFLFQAIQATFVPELAGLAATGRHDRFRQGMRRLVALVGGLLGLATVGGWVAGPAVVGALFGAEFALGSRDLAMLAAASSCYLLALTLAQVLIALARPARVALGWSIGTVGFAIGVLTTSDLLLRVQIGLLCGTVGATAAMGLLLAGPLARQAPIRSVGTAAG